MLPVLALISVFVSVFLMVSGVLASRKAEATSYGSFASMREDAMKSGAGFRALVAVSGYLARLNDRRALTNYFEGVRKRVLKAGNPLPLHPLEFLAMKEISCVAGLAIGAFLVEDGLFTAALGALGFFYPDIWLRERTTKRENAILRALPFSLDLLTLSVEAGLDLTSGIQRLIDGSTPGPLRDELFLMLQEIKMGRSRAEAMRNLVARADLPEVSSVFGTLVQADKLGTGMGQSLRVLSEQVRTGLFQRAEKKAMEAPVKMTFPLLFIFVSVFLLLFGSIIIDFMRGRMF